MGFCDSVALALIGHAIIRGSFQWGKIRPLIRTSRDEDFVLKLSNESTCGRRKQTSVKDPPGVFSKIIPSLGVSKAHKT